MAESLRKKMKRDVHTIFRDFQANEDKMSMLKEACQAVDEGWTEMNVKLLKITETNARACESFTRATCTTESYEERDNVISYSFGSLFANGIYALEKYVENCEVPEDLKSRKALIKLLHFMTWSLTSLKPPEKDVSDCEWVVQLTQHLFSKLAMSSKFTIEKRYQSKANLKKFPCGKSEDLDGEFGDTSFGCSDAWHGSVDIYLEDITIQVASDKEETVEDYSDSNTRGSLSSDYSDSGNESSVERLIDSSSQMLSQCIVFSFLQRKQNEKEIAFNSYLVPSIGVGRKAVAIFLYDSRNDVLLRSAYLNLFELNKLNPKMILCVWLAMNYRCFCTGITDSMKEYKAHFFDFVGDYLTKYKQEVGRPVGKVSNYDATEENWAWAKKCGRVSKNPVTLECVPLEALSHNAFV